MRIFLTGATGFLGGKLLTALCERGHDVTALVRDPSRLSEPAGLPARARCLAGTIEAPAAWRGELRGHDAVVHAAAVVKMWARDRGEFDRVNVEGTRAILQASVDADVPLMVHASSFMALGPSNGAPLTEKDPRRTLKVHNDYERTKLAADHVGREFIERGAPLFILYPGVVHGPGSLTAGNIVTRSLILILNGKLPVGLPLKAWSYAYVDDVVRAFVRVIEQGAPSRRYILGGENRTGEEFHAALERVTGRRPPRFNLPLPLASVAGLGELALAELFGREPVLLTPGVARIYGKAWALDSSLAAREIGYEMTPLDDALRRTVAWLRERGEVR